MYQCLLSLALCVEVIFLQPVTASYVWFHDPQAKRNKETTRNMSRVLNINNTYVIGRIKSNLEPDGIFIDRQNSCSLHRPACCKQVGSGVCLSASAYKTHTAGLGATGRSNRKV